MSNMNEKEKVIVTSGYFDPLHVGHLEYLEMASKLGDKLVVIINNDKQAILKKGKPFMAERDRLEIVFALGIVDEVIISVDEDASVSKSLEMVARFHELSSLTFCKGGDRNFGEVPEVKTCERLDIEMVDGLGEKIRSSSEYTGLTHTPDSALDFPREVSVPILEDELDLEEELEAHDLKARESGLLEV